MSDLDSDNDSGSERETDGDPLKCRMYVNDYPSINELVMVEVKKIVDMGAYCKLLEYNDLEGMLLMSELQRKRIRSVKRAIKEGRQEIVQVLRVNKKKGYIDLSKKRVTPDQRPLVEDRWNKSKAVHSIIRQIAYLSNDRYNKDNNNNKYSMLDLYKKFAWKMAKDYGSLYDAFKVGMDNFDEMFKKYPEIPNDIRKDLIKNIEKRLKPKIVTVRAKVELTCFNREGVDAIKKSLKKGLLTTLDINDITNNTNPNIDDIKSNDESNNNNNNNNINNNKINIELINKGLKLVIKLVAPPLFTISVNTLEPINGKKLVNKCINVIKYEIETFGGECDVKQEPEVIALEI